ncbi:MAG TPA: polyphosphate kinase 1 [Spirochaetia bacterium]|nr:polyphosphate kinase 1 [Spirochaetia bacterium]
MKKNLIYKEVSWLSFNERVLQEAENPEVPLSERIRFLGIYSSNLDEFFRVRVATLRRLLLLGKKSMKFIDGDPKEILEEIQEITIVQHKKFDDVYEIILKELERKGIYFVDETQLSPEQGNFVRRYFLEIVRPKIFPIMVESRFKFPALKDNSHYLAVELGIAAEPHRKKYSVIEIPSRNIPRFIVLPSSDSRKFVIFSDDVVRYGLPNIFANLEFDTFHAYGIKLTRDSELDMEDDFSMSYLSRIHKSLEKREFGRPIRFVYDEEMPDEMLQFIIKKLKFKKVDTIIPGARYHNLKDFIHFPDILPVEKSFTIKRVFHSSIDIGKSLFSAVSKRDILLHFPYHPFDYVIDLLREASIDPKVMSIKITLYRVARYSSVVNALINAKKNRKEVIVLLELQARFDEEANIYWANQLKEEGVKVIFGIPGLKVHSKVCIIGRKEKGSIAQYACIATGNFNEDTAKLYTDTCLLTKDVRITSEVARLFDFFETNYKVSNFNHLIVSPFMMRREMVRLIDTEIKNAKEGKISYIYLKLNNLSDRKLIEKLYEASTAGVTIKIIARGMFSLVTGIPGVSEHIEAISIVDRYLEHARYYIFANGGKERVFISSADWLPRNIDGRIEVSCPVYDKTLKQEIKDLFLIEWKDNVKARLLNARLDNTLRKREPGEPEHRAQYEKYLYIKQIHGEVR